MITRRTFFKALAAVGIVSTAKAVEQKPTIATADASENYRWLGEVPRMNVWYKQGVLLGAQIYGGAKLGDLVYSDHDGRLTINHDDHGPLGVVHRVRGDGHFDIMFKAAHVLGPR
jgi:phage major head subunit gpT-like protein